MAHETCDKVMSAVKNSQLDFFIQETPFSCFITIRKKFKRGFKIQVSDKEDISLKANPIVTDLKSENKGLRETVEELQVQLEAANSESFLLQSKLEKAEKVMIKHFEDASKTNSKHSEEIFTLKSQNQKNSETISVKKSEVTQAGKTIKALEKNIYNMEIKNENLIKKIENLNTSKNEIKKEKDKLAKKIKKTLKKNLTKQKLLK